MIFIIKDYFENNAPTIKNYDTAMIRLKITNLHPTTSLSFNIHNITITVKANETFEGNFAPFNTLSVQSSVPFRCYVSSWLNNDELKPEPESPPRNVENLIIHQVTATTVTLQWDPPLYHDGITSYDISQNDQFRENVVNPSVTLANLSPSTFYTFTVQAKNEAGQTSTGVSITVTTLELDETPPTLTVTPSGFFSQSHEITITSSEPATIYYTLNGDEPTSTSPIYSGPFIITETTTVQAYAIDNAGNKSTLQSALYQKIGIQTEGIILHYDFTNRSGETNNSISDTIHGVVASLIGLSHDGVSDGYVTDQGLLVNREDYVEIPTNASPLNQLISFENGLTIQMASFNTNGSHWKTVDGKFTAARSDVFIPYLTTTGQQNTRAINSYWFKDEQGQKKSYQDWLNPIDSHAINLFTLRFNTDQTASLFINDAINENDPRPVPTDFASTVNALIQSPLQLRKDFVAHNQAPETIVAFAIYNRALTDEEVKNNYDYYQQTEQLIGISALPQTISLAIGESQKLFIEAIPSQYTSELTLDFQSNNEQIVEVDNRGRIKALTAGQTSVNVMAAYEEQSFTTTIPIDVQLSPSLPPSNRTVTEIVINKKKETMVVGEATVLMATALSEGLPFDVLNDNIVFWESGNIQIATVQYGVVEALSSGTTTITAYDSSKTIFASYTLTVSERAEQPIDEADILHVDAEQYDIHLDGTNALATTNGIQAAFDDALLGPYKKVIFPYGHYLVNPTVRTLFPPTNIIIDFSDSKIQIEASEKTTTGYRMFYFTNLENTKLINTHIYGEKNDTTVGESTEGCLSVLIDDCKNISFESCTFNQSPGFNFITGTIHNRELGEVKSDTVVSWSHFEPGDIDDQGNSRTEINSHRFRSSTYLNVSGLGSYYLLGYTQGYQGFRYLRSRLYSIYFYDENHLFISSQTYNLQFYNYDKPQAAKWVKIVIYQEAPPADGDTDFNGAVAFLRTIGMPRQCKIKNCHFEENTSTGLAMCGGQEWLIEGNTFVNNKGRTPGCDIDWEDGWDAMALDVVRYNRFTSPLGIILSAGSSLAIYENEFTMSTMKAWGRTQNFRIYNNIFMGKGAITNDFSTQAESILARNIFTDGAGFTTGKEHENGSYQVHTYQNTTI